MGTLARSVHSQRILTAWFILLLCWPATAAEDKPSAVRDLRYGVALFHYFQRDYYDSLSELMVAEQRGGIRGHGDTGQIMKGGLSLSMGMERQAADVFRNILNESHPREVRDAAWFYLAKLRYRRADWEGAAASLANISGELNRRMRQEKDALQINLAIRRQQLDQAEQVLRNEKKLTPWLPYVYYNLGAARIRDGDHAAGVYYFDSLADLPLESEEHLSLRDKALTAAGYSWMQQGNYNAAIDRFTRVRLQSPLINRALLGYGWAATEAQQYALALAPWQTLVKRSPVSPSVQEALLAIPYAYEKVGATGQALEAFKAAESNYSNQLSVINGINAYLQAGALLESLQADVAENAYLQRLSELLSQQQFQNQVRDLRDLLELEDRLQDWRDKLQIYRHLLDQREAVREDRLMAVREKQFPKNLAKLQAQYETMAAKLEAAEQRQDAMAVADDTTLSLWQRVVSAQRAIDRLDRHGEDTAEYREPLRRFKGVLMWQAAETFPENIWSAKKALKQLQTDLETARQQQDRLAGIIDQAPDIAPYRIRLASLEQRLVDQQLALNNLLDHSETRLLASVSGELQQQVARLRYYQGHARLSVARLYDVARDAAAPLPDQPAPESSSRHREPMAVKEADQ